jgi:hypothetical protein
MWPRSTLLLSILVSAGDWYIHLTEVQACPTSSGLECVILQEARLRILIEREEYQCWWLSSRVSIVHLKWYNGGPIDPATPEIREKLTKQLQNLSAISAIGFEQLTELADHIYKTTHPDFDWIWTEQMWELFLRIHRIREKERAKCFEEVERFLAESQASHRAAMSVVDTVWERFESWCTRGRPTKEEVDRVRNPQRYKGPETDD